MTLQSCWAYIGWSSLSIVFADASLYTTLRSLYTPLGWPGFHCMPPTHNNAGMGAYNRMPGDSVHNYQAADFVLGFRWSLLVLRHSIRAPLMAHLTTKRKIVSCKPSNPPVLKALGKILWIGVHGSAHVCPQPYYKAGLISYHDNVCWYFVQAVDESWGRWWRPTPKPPPWPPAGVGREGQGGSPGYYPIITHPRIHQLGVSCLISTVKYHLHSSFNASFLSDPDKVRVE